MFLIYVGEISVLFEGFILIVSSVEVLISESVLFDLVVGFQGMGWFEKIAAMRVHESGK